MPTFMARRPDTWAAYEKRDDEEFWAAAAFFFRGSVGIGEVLLHTDDPRWQTQYKRFALAHAVGTEERRRVGRKEPLEVADVLRLALDDDRRVALSGAELDEALRQRAITVQRAPHSHLAQVVAAIHDRVWELGKRELTWGVEPDAPHRFPEGGDWTLTFKCQAQPFRFWNESGDGSVNAPPAHPTRRGKRPGIGINGERNALLRGGSGVTAVRLPRGDDPYLREAHQFMVTVHEYRILTAEVTDTLVELLLDALDCGETYAGVIGGFPPPLVLS